MRKVSTEEIEQLYAFTRAHYVEYYDVQTELVDHLASAMETNWEKEPGLTFEKNLQREFKKFGVYGFSDVVEKKVNAMNKRYFKIMLRETGQYLKKPKVILSLLAFELVYFSLLKMEYGYLWLSGLMVVLFMVCLFPFLKKVRKEKKQKEQGEKVFLLESMLNSTGGISSGFIVPLQIVQFSFTEYTAVFWLQILVSLILALFLLIGVICYFVLPAKKEELLQEYSPEVRFLK